MNIFDNDFPEVTEAYHGSLEDWQELFERYAFPVGEETDTSIEMKRYLKRNPEATYEDWLDRVIKFVRDELWYKEKINLSIRELYLAVNKVARLSEKLRTAYNKMVNCDLTEDTATETTSVDAEQSNASEFTFTDIIRQLYKNTNSEDELTEDDKKYWLRLRKLLLEKYVSMGRIATNTWPARFISFYKSYLSENALKASVAAVFSKAFSEVNFSDADTHELLLTDEAFKARLANASLCDFIAKLYEGSTSELELECKEFGTTSSVHNAKFVVRHTAIRVGDNDTNGFIKWCLVGHLDDFLNYLTPCFSHISKTILSQYQTLKANLANSSEDTAQHADNYHILQGLLKQQLYQEGLPIYILQDGVKLNSTIDHPQVLEEVKNVFGEGKQKLSAIKKRFDILLNKLEIDAEDEKLITILDKSTAQTLQTLDLLGGSSEGAKIDLPNTSVNTAITDYQAATKKVASIAATNTDKNS